MKRENVWLAIAAGGIGALVVWFAVVVLTAVRVL